MKVSICNQDEQKVNNMEHMADSEMMWAVG